MIYFLIKNSEKNKGFFLEIMEKKKEKQKKNLGKKTALINLFPTSAFGQNKKSKIHR